MTATMSVPIDELDADEFIVDDWETTELPVPITDQATPAGIEVGKTEIVPQPFTITPGVVGDWLSAMLFLLDFQKMVIGIAQIR